MSSESVNRVGQWKFTDGGCRRCIAEGGGYVMARAKGRLPECFEVRIWDELWNWTPDETQLEVNWE